MFLYRMLLHLYPSSHRAEYGDEMTAIFERELRQIVSFPNRVSFLLETVWEVISNAAAMHWQIAQRDLRYSVRSLLHSRGFTITALLLVVLGIGANLSVFTLADFVLIRPLPFPEPDRLVKLWQKQPGYSSMELSPPNYRDWKAASTSFEGMAAYFTLERNLIGEGDPVRVRGCATTGELFPILGRQPLLGRYFSAEDDRTGAAGTVVLSYGLWQSQFGGENNIVGKSVFLDDMPYVVVGIMPADFNFPSRETQFWTTLALGKDDLEDRTNNLLIGIGRLKRDASLPQARSELSVIASRLATQYPKENAETGAVIIPLRDEISVQARLLLTALCGAGLCVLVITCANLANLLLTRSLARQKEFSIRVALGANRRHILRQLITENVLLGLAGGVGATLIAVGALPLLSRLVPSSLPLQQVPSVDARMLLIALGLTAVTSIIFGVVPAIRICGNADLTGLREGVRTGGAGKQGTRAALVMAEVAVSVVLLISSGLLIRALWRVRATDPGFRTEGVLTAQTALPIPKYEKVTTRDAFYTKVLGEVRRVPGVSDAAYITWLPMTIRGGIWPVVVNGSSQIRLGTNSASLRFVSSGFFSTLGIPLKAGRDVSETDTQERPFVAVVSESLVRRYWPSEQPIGRHFHFGLHDREVVGVVGDVRVRGLERTSEPQVYVPYKQVLDGWLIGYTPKDLVIHSSQAPETLLPTIRKIIASADPEQPISNVRTMAEIVGGETESRTVQMRVLGTFTAIAILLAALGIYGLLSFVVSLRAQEFGIRMALGADRSDIFRIVLRRGAQLAAAGLLPGLALAYVAARLMEALLAGITPHDGLVFSIAATTCFITALLGSLFPALRAVRVDPTTAMRAE